MGVQEWRTKEEGQRMGTGREGRRREGGKIKINFNH